MCACEAAVVAVHVGVEEAQQVPVVQDGCQETAALLLWSGARRPMAQARLPGLPTLVDPGLDGREQAAAGFAAGQGGRDALDALGQFAQDQYAL